MHATPFSSVDRFGFVNQLRLPLLQQPDELSDMQQFAVLWTQAQPSVTAFIASLVPRHHDAEDILQRTAASLILMRDQYDPSRPFVGWAIGVARVEVLRHRQKARREKTVFDTDTMQAITIDRKHMRLDSGQVVVSCPTKSSRSLVLETNDARIIDLGTEYGVRVIPRSCSNVQVFQGSVQVTAKSNPTNLQTLSAGHACQIPAATAAGLATAVALPFVRQGQLEITERAEGSSPDAAWAGRLRTLSSDPTLLFCSDFNPLWDGKSVANLARPSDSWLTELNPAAPLEFADGRLAGDQSLHFSKLHQGLRLNIPGRFQSLTFAAWIKLDSEPIGSARHRGLVMPDGWGAAGEVHWQIKRHGIRHTVFDRGDDEDPRYSADTETLFDGGWHQCVSVIDNSSTANANTVSHYLDGKLIYSRKIPQAIPTLTLGNCCVGNWVPSPEDLADDRTLGGSVDDLLIWNRLLGADEIHSLFAGSTSASKK